MAALSRETNVLLILVDDLRPVTQSFGGPVSAPNLDALAERGFSFLNHYANVPVCGASRASMLSGLAPSTGRFLTFNSRLDQDAPGAESLPAYFKRHGWTVEGNGKIFDVIDDSADSWSRPVWNPEMRWQSATSEDRRGEHLQKSYINPVSGGRPPTWEKLEVDDLAYPDGEIAARSAQDLQRLADADAPFFLAVGFRKPHLPFNAPARYWTDDVPDARLLPQSWPNVAASLPDIARHRSLELRMQYDALPLIGDESDEVARELVRSYHAATRYIDALIGQLVAALNASGAADNTVVVVAGDHGFLLGEQRMWTKHALFETALRTPLVIVDPSREGGHKVSAVADLLDLYPTLAQLAGLPAPEALEGHSLLPLLDTPSLPERPEKRHSVSRWLNGESVRDARYRYTAWYDDAGEVVEQMLFDLAQDPKEQRNIASDSDARSVVSQLQGELAARRVGQEWSDELDTLMGQLSFANSTVGSLVLAVVVEPARVAYLLVPIMLLVVGFFMLRRRRPAKV